MSLTIDVLDPQVKIPLTQRPRLLFETLRSGSYHSDFVVDTIERDRVQSTPVIVPPTEQELDEWKTAYDELYTLPPKSYPIRTLIRRLLMLHKRYVGTRRNQTTSRSMFIFSGIDGQKTIDDAIERSWESPVDVHYHSAKLPCSSEKHRCFVDGTEVPSALDSK